MEDEVGPQRKSCQTDIQLDEIAYMEEYVKMNKEHEGNIKR